MITDVQNLPRGVKILHDPVRNKGTAFSEAERSMLGLHGLLPPRIHTQEQQVMRVLENIRSKASDLERYIYLVALQDRNETLFYRVIVDHLEEMMPIIYTPTVGLACQKYGHIYRRPRGLFLSAREQGRFEEVLGNWPHTDVRIIVVTDGERILGLGDLGADGMGIPIGKLALYTACAGIDPTKCLPVTLDVGTDNEQLLNDPLYIGLQHKRIRGGHFDELVDEFVSAAHKIFPRAVIQFEDFATENAFRLVERYQNEICAFDDDIQGTAAVGLAGILSALRLTGAELRNMRFLFLGAGEAAVGIGDLIVAALVHEGVPEAEARRQCWFFDSKGLVVSSRPHLAGHKLRFAHDYGQMTDFGEAIRSLKPHAIIGACGIGGTFTRPMVESMAEINERPMVFALSNPTSQSECTAEQAYTWTQGRAIFASGSPFKPVTHGGQMFVPGQGNNAYIFPGVGLGLIASEATRATDEMFLIAARTLARTVTEEDLRVGRIYPGLDRIRAVSANIAESVADVAFQRGLAGIDRPGDLGAFIRSLMFDPAYPQYVY